MNRYGIFAFILSTHFSNNEGDVYSSLRNLDFEVEGLEIDSVEQHRI
jgi:hypothetical protein